MKVLKIFIENEFVEYILVEPGLSVEDILSDYANGTAAEKYFITEYLEEIKEQFELVEVQEIYL